MPFNGSGTFSIVNTFVPNTTILSAAVNQNFTDIATGLSDCLTRDGQAGMTAAFKAISGSLGAPGIAFNADATAGLYLPATGVVGLVAKSLGLLVNSSIYQVSSVAVQSGGSNYAVGDTITLTGGTAIAQAILTVATLSGSAVATATVTYPGAYSVKPSDPVAQGSSSGSGTGATFNITWTTQYTRSIVTNEAGALPWQRLGSSSYIAGLMNSPNAYALLRQLVTIGAGLSLSTATNPPTVTATLNPTLVPNYLSGLGMSTAGSSSTMTIAAGVANDSTNTTLMKLTSAISKTTASWVVGNNQGGLDTGSIANSTWYHFYEIERLDTGVVDVIFSTSASAPTLPANYTIYRRIASGLTNTSAQWVKFSQVGDEFLWDTPVQDFNSTTLGTSATLATLSVPPGVVTNALVNMRGFQSSGNAYVYVSPTDVADLAPSDSAAPGATAMYLATAVAVWAGRFTVRADVSSQVRARSSTTNTNLRLVTLGWVDYRGKQ